MSEISDKALEAFTEYFVRNYPGPDTVIFDPKWHAPKIFNAAKAALNSSDLTQELDRLRDENERLMAQLERMVDLAEVRLMAIHKALEPAAFGITGIESPEDGLNYMTGVLRAALNPVGAP